MIADKKRRGEWAESVFLVRAGEHGLPVSKPWGDSRSYDSVVGLPGHFVAVQVKCTIAKAKNGVGYVCSVCSSHKPYPPGSFDFLAAYAILEDTWYIVPETAIRGMSAITLCSTMPKYEKYREAWDLLRIPLLAKSARRGVPDASELEEVEEPASEEKPLGPGVARMQGAMNAFRRMMEKGGRGML